MKIISIRISNLLSFEYKSDVALCDEIRFNLGMNVLIGPNGSGKSNFLEILNKLFNNALIQTAEYTETHIRSWELKGKNQGIPQDFRNTIKTELKQFSTHTNKNSNSKNIKIKIEIALTDNDTKNLLFIHQNLSEINMIGGEYSQSFPNFPIVSTNDLINLKSLTLFFENQSPEYLTNINNFVGAEQFAFFYLNHFKHIQYVIEIARKRHQKNWSYLNDTFAILSSLRNYNQIDPVVQIQTSGGDEINSAKRSLENENLLHSVQNEPNIFRYLFKKFGYEFHLHVTEKGLRRGYDPMTDFTDPLFLKINQILVDTLDLKLYIRRPDPNQLSYHFDFVESTTGKLITISELSSGEKGLIHFIFCIYGNDLFNGVMIIDEPEIHMHPQMQETCLRFMRKMIDDGMQFIVATHSPLFVNSDTVEGVHRFYKESSFTKSILPVITESERDLMHLLTLTNSSKIFFAKKVLLVEGDSDEYFYKTYFEHYKKLNNLDVRGVEILKINGKGACKKWMAFLKKYQISAYYIGDTDNLLVNYFSIHAKNWKQKHGNALLRNEIEHIKHQHVTDHTLMMTEINRLVTSNIFLLSDGSLEDYLSMHIQQNPDFEDVINFCNGFDQWISSNPNDPLVEETKKFFDAIIKL